MIRYALLLLLVLAGCCSGPTVRIESLTSDGWKRGAGVIVGERSVATALHVVSDAGCIRVLHGSWSSNAKVKRVWISGAIEPTVWLETDAVFPCSGVKTRVPQRGDSGSPLFGQGGDVVGILYGYTSGGAPVMLPVARGP